MHPHDKHYAYDEELHDQSVSNAGQVDTWGRKVPVGYLASELHEKDRLTETVSQICQFSRKGPDPLSDSVVRSAQLLRETSGADQ